MITRTQIGEICSKPHPSKDITTALMDLFQDEIDRLKQQHTEEIEKLETQIKAGIDLQTILLNTIEIERNTHKGYRQAVKDILGGEGLNEKKTI